MAPQLLTPPTRAAGRSAAIPTPLLAVALAALAATCVGGCASSVPRRAMGPVLAPTPSWSLALADPRVGRQHAALTRADRALGLPAPGFARTADAWPAPERASIERSRRVTLTRTTHTLLFFDTPPAQRHAAPRR